MRAPSLVLIKYRGHESTGLDPTDVETAYLENRRANCDGVWLAVKATLQDNCRVWMPDGP